MDAGHVLGVALSFMAGTQEIVEKISGDEFDLSGYLPTCSIAPIDRQGGMIPALVEVVRNIRNAVFDDSCMGSTLAPPRSIIGILRPRPRHTNRGHGMR